MEKKKIEKQYNTKIELLNKYNQYYYDNSKPLVSDNEYDNLKSEILLLEKNMNF